MTSITRSHRNKDKGYAAAILTVRPCQLAVLVALSILPDIRMSRTGMTNAWLSVMCRCFLGMSVSMRRDRQRVASHTSPWPPRRRSGTKMSLSSPEPFAVSVLLRSAALHVSHLCGLMMLPIVSWECLPESSGSRLPLVILRPAGMLTRCVLLKVVIAADNDFGV